MPQLVLDLDSNLPLAALPEALPPPMSADASDGFRPIHYLGSKLRFVSDISVAIDELDPSGGAVLDLFAGSGTVALALSARRAVLASDIQEYSRVICSALLQSGLPDASIEHDFAACFAGDSEFRTLLSSAALPLVRFEDEAIASALNGDAEPICQVLEHGSILAFELNNGSVRVGPMQTPLETAAELMKASGLKGNLSATALRYFGGAYFSYRQALELDAISHTITKFPESNRDLLTAALLSTASEIVNTVGKQFAQPIRPRSKGGEPKKHLISKIVRDRSVSALGMYTSWLRKYARSVTHGTGHRAMRADYVDALDSLKSKFSVVYADPPYTRDHYSRFYHVLETLARRDNPDIAKNPGAGDGQLSRGLYRDDRHQSPFCIKTQVRSAFQKLFERVASCGAQLVVSYSPFDDETNARPRLMSIDELVSLGRESFASVEVRAVNGVLHSKLNHTRLNYGAPVDAEILLLCSQPLNG